MAVVFVVEAWMAMVPVVGWKHSGGSSDSRRVSRVEALAKGNGAEVQRRTGKTREARRARWKNRDPQETKGRDKERHRAEDGTA